MAKPKLEGFNALNGWLKSFKRAHGILEYRISGEGENVPLVTVKAWLERLPDIVKYYEPLQPMEHGWTRTIFWKFAE